MKVEYELKGAGWALATIVTKTEEISVTVSYICDSLAELANAAFGLGTGANKAVVVFMDEPGEHQLILEKTDAETAQATLCWYDDSRKPVQEETLLETTVKIKRFQHDVLFLMDNLLREHGLAGYKEKWHKDFPVWSYERLKNLLQN